MNDKQAYDEAAKKHRELGAFLENPRCINCDRWTSGNCAEYGAVPEDHWYTPNDCEKWHFRIPF